MNFSPAKVVQQCIDDVSSICFDTYSVVPHVQIEDFMHKNLYLIFLMLLNIYYVNY